MLKNHCVISKSAYARNTVVENRHENGMLIWEYKCCLAHAKIEWWICLPCKTALPLKAKHAKDSVLCLILRTTRVPGPTLFPNLFQLWSSMKIVLEFIGKKDYAKVTNNSLFLPVKTKMSFQLFKCISTLISQSGRIFFEFSLYQHLKYMPLVNYTHSFCRN